MAPLAITVTTFGGVGYYADGPDLGVRVCLEGLFPEAKRRLEELRQTQTSGLREDHCRGWYAKASGKRSISSGSRSETSSRPWASRSSVSTCRYLQRGLRQPRGGLVGFQNMAAEVPGVGSFESARTKASMSSRDTLERRILVDRSMLGLIVSRPRSSRRVGGSIDTCRHYTAARSSILVRKMPWSWRWRNWSNSDCRNHRHAGPKRGPTSLSGRRPCRFPPPGGHAIHTTGGAFIVSAIGSPRIVSIVGAS